MKYFTFKEMCRSNVAQQQGIDNIPEINEVKNIIWFVRNVLDPLREIFGHEIVVNSGFRTQKLNLLVCGKENSYHLEGLAADIRPSIVDTALNSVTWFDFIHSVYEFKNKCIFGSYIDIFEYGSFVHIEFDARRFTKENSTKDFRLLTYK